MTQEIIVCDDEPHIVRAISLKFTRAGFDVKGTSDAESCWRLLHRSQPPALLIVDDTLPSGPGAIELVSRIRNDVQLADLPIIMLSGKDSDPVDDQELVAGLNIAQIMKKPFSPRELLGVVCRLVGHELDPNTAIHDGEHNLRLTMHSRAATYDASRAATDDASRVTTPTS